MLGEPPVHHPRARLRSVSVRNQLSQRIEDGEFPAGTRLPSEPALATELGVSRATLREALRVLESEGRLRRAWGSGTYVAEGRRVVNSLDVNFGVTQAIRAAGMQAGSEQGRHWLEPASHSEATRLKLQPGQDVLTIERVRTADGRPVVLSRDIIPAVLLGGRTDIAELMLRGSVYEVMERELGIVIEQGIASFQPVRADLIVARLLGIRRGELLLAIWQVDYDQEGRPLLSSHEYHIADAFEFSVMRRGPGRRFT
jgi:GntR family transcriptional regulator